MLRLQIWRLLRLIENKIAIHNREYCNTLQGNVQYILGKLAIHNRENSNK
jgi:hypothetical protein